MIYLNFLFVLASKYLIYLVCGLGGSLWCWPGGPLFWSGPLGLVLGPALWAPGEVIGVSVVVCVRPYCVVGDCSCPLSYCCSSCMCVCVGPWGVVRSCSCSLSYCGSSRMWVCCGIELFILLLCFMTHSPLGPFGRLQGHQIAPLQDPEARGTKCVSRFKHIVKLEKATASKWFKTMRSCQAAVETL